MTRREDYDKAECARALAPPDATEEQVRIMRLALGGARACPLCGYARFTGLGVHPFAGVNGWTKSQTIFCNGKVKIYPKGFIHREPLEEGE